MPKEPLQFDAFLAYARIDDARRDVTRFHQALQAELRQQFGKGEFHIFLDVEGIDVGENWQHVIESGLNRAAFFVALVSPGFFGSDECRKEVAVFVARARAAGLEPRIFPVVIYDISSVEHDDFYLELMSRQFVDFSGTKLEDDQSKAYRVAVGKLATTIASKLRSPAEPARASIEELRESLKNAETERAGAAAALDVSQGQLQDLQTQVVELQHEVIRVKDDALVEGTELRSRLQEVTDKLKLAGVEKDALAEQLHSAEREVQRQNAALATAPQMTRKLEADLASERLGPKPTEKPRSRTIWQSPLAASLVTALIVAGASTPFYLGRTAKPNPVVSTGPRTFVVSQAADGDYHTISEAIKAAHDGDRILVKPGTYREGIFVDKVLDIIGEGPPGTVNVEANDTPAITFTADSGRIFDLALQQVGQHAHCVDIQSGTLELQGCDITSEGYSCVAMRNDAKPLIRGNRIFAGRLRGIVASDHAEGTIVSNDISGCGYPGVEIMNDANPQVMQNLIRRGNRSGVYIWGGGRGRILGNSIFDNANAGITVADGARPQVLDNQVRGNGSEGILLYHGGGGQFENNDLRGNGKGSWLIDAISLATFTGTSQGEKSSRTGNLEDPPKPSTSTAAVHSPVNGRESPPISFRKATDHGPAISRIKNNKK